MCNHLPFPTVESEIHGRRVSVGGQRPMWDILRKERLDLGNVKKTSLHHPPSYHTL